jgi:tetrahydromethanopterin S-methyltransferase subunit G
MPDEQPKPTLKDVLLGAGTQIPPPEFTTQPDDRAASERNLDFELKDETITSLRQDRGQRGKLGWCIFGLVAGWLLFVAYTVLFAGFRVFGFSLPDSVMMMLLGTTTANILGILYVVTSYLFPKKQ